MKAREKELKRKWKDEKSKLENERKDLEEQVRGYKNVNEVLKKELITVFVESVARNRPIGPISYDCRIYLPA
jgi:RNA-splicing ligase RtcB